MKHLTRGTAILARAASAPRSIPSSRAWPSPREREACSPRTTRRWRAQYKGWRIPAAIAANVCWGWDSTTACRELSGLWRKNNFPRRQPYHDTAIPGAGDQPRSSCQYGPHCAVGGGRCRPRVPELHAAHDAGVPVRPVRGLPPPAGTRHRVCRTPPGRTAPAAFLRVSFRVLHVDVHTRRLPTSHHDHSNLHR